MNTFEIIQTLGLTSANLPEDIVESDDAFRAPMAYYKLKIGLPENFLLEGAVKTNWYTHHLHLGPKWTYPFSRLSFSIGTDAAYFTGTMEEYGFDSKMTGWNIYPNISIGYLFPNFSITMKSELILLLDQTSRTGKIELTSSFKTFSGYSFAFYLEQPLWKNNFFVIGFKSNYTRFYYPIWFSFSTFDRFFFIPEVLFSFNL
jgi:hypothetical protein